MQRSNHALSAATWHYIGLVYYAVCEVNIFLFNPYLYSLNLLIFVGTGQYIKILVSMVWSLCFEKLQLRLKFSMIGCSVSLLILIFSVNSFYFKWQFTLPIELEFLRPPAQENWARNSRIYSPSIVTIIIKVFAPVSQSLGNTAVKLLPGDTGTRSEL